MRFETSEDFRKEFPRIPRSYAEQLMLSHSIMWSDFIEEFGERDKYNTKAVLEWMGY